MLRRMFWRSAPRFVRKALNRRRITAKWRAIDQALASFPIRPDAPTHTLPGTLIVSLTSYAKRFPTLHRTLKSLLDQTVRPDKLILWIAFEDAPLLPEEVLELRQHGLVIEQCEDIRNFKKIVPVLTRHPDAFITIADDDLFYEPDWLARLIAAFDSDQPTVVCGRAHRLGFGEDGQLAPYHSWEGSVTDARSELPSRDLLPTGCGGVLYPPGALSPLTTDLNLIRRLSPTSDDVWLFFMFHTNGWSIKRVPGAGFESFAWPETQQDALKHFHKNGSKDQHLADMSREFGIPDPAGSTATTSP